MAQSYVAIASIRPNLSGAAPSAAAQAAAVTESSAISSIGGEGVAADTSVYFSASTTDALRCSSPGSPAILPFYPNATSREGCVTTSARIKKGNDLNFAATDASLLKSATAVSLVEAALCVSCVPPAQKPLFPQGALFKGGENVAEACELASAALSVTGGAKNVDSRRVSVNGREGSILSETQQQHASIQSNPCSTLQTANLGEPTEEQERPRANICSRKQKFERGEKEDIATELWGYDSNSPQFCLSCPHTPATAPSAGPSPSLFSAQPIAGMLVPQKQANLPSALHCSCGDTDEASVSSSTQEASAAVDATQEGLNEKFQQQHQVTVEPSAHDSNSSPLLDANSNTSAGGNLFLSQGSANSSKPATVSTQENTDNAFTFKQSAVVKQHNSDEDVPLVLTNTSLAENSAGANENEKNQQLCLPTCSRSPVDVVEAINDGDCSAEPASAELGKKCSNKDIYLGAFPSSSIAHGRTEYTAEKAVAGTLAIKSYTSSVPLSGHNKELCVSREQQQQLLQTKPDLSSNLLLSQLSIPLPEHEKFVEDTETFTGDCASCKCGEMDTSAAHSTRITEIDACSLSQMPSTTSNRENLFMHCKTGVSVCDKEFEDLLANDGAAVAEDGEYNREDGCMQSVSVEEQESTQSTDRLSSEFHGDRANFWKSIPSSCGGSSIPTSASFPSTSASKEKFRNKQNDQRQSKLDRRILEETSRATREWLTATVPETMQHQRQQEKAVPEHEQHRQMQLKCEEMTECWRQIGAGAVLEKALFASAESSREKNSRRSAVAAAAAEESASLIRLFKLFGGGGSCQFETAIEAVVRRAVDLQRRLATLLTVTVRHQLNQRLLVLALSILLDKQRREPERVEELMCEQQRLLTILESQQQQALEDLPQLYGDCSEAQLLQQQLQQLHQAELQLRGGRKSASVASGTPQACPNYKCLEQKQQHRQKANSAELATTRGDDTSGELIVDSRRLHGHPSSRSSMGTSEDPETGAVINSSKKNCFNLDYEYPREEPASTRGLSRSVWAGRRSGEYIIAQPKLADVSHEFSKHSAAQFPCISRASPNKNSAVAALKTDEIPRELCEQSCSRLNYFDGWLDKAAAGNATGIQGRQRDSHGALLRQQKMHNDYKDYLSRKLGQQLLECTISKCNAVGGTDRRSMSTSEETPAAIDQLNSANMNSSVFTTGETAQTLTAGPVGGKECSRRRDSGDSGAGRSNSISGKEDVTFGEVGAAAAASMTIPEAQEPDRLSSKYGSSCRNTSVGLRSKDIWNDPSIRADESQRGSTCLYGKAGVPVVHPGCCRSSRVAVASLAGTTAETTGKNTAAASKVKRYSLPTVDSTAAAVTRDVAMPLCSTPGLSAAYSVKSNCGTSSSFNAGGKAAGGDVHITNSFLSVYSRGSNARHQNDPFPHNVMIQLIQPLPTGIKLELKSHRPSFLSMATHAAAAAASATGSSTAQQSVNQGTSFAGIEAPAPREYALRVSLTRHETKYCSFHSLHGILPAYNEAVRLRNKFAGLPFVLPSMTLQELHRRKERLDAGKPLPGHGPREAFMTVQERVTYYKQTGIGITPQKTEQVPNTSKDCSVSTAFANQTDTAPYLARGAEVVASSCIFGRGKRSDFGRAVTNANISGAPVDENGSFNGGCNSSVEYAAADSSGPIGHYRPQGNERQSEKQQNKDDGEGNSDCSSTERDSSAAVDVAAKRGKMSGEASSAVIEKTQKVQHMQHQQKRQQILDSDSQQQRLFHLSTNKQQQRHHHISDCDVTDSDSRASTSFGKVGKAAPRIDLSTNEKIESSTAGTTVASVLYSPSRRHSNCNNSSGNLSRVLGSNTQVVFPFHGEESISGAAGMEFLDLLANGGATPKGNSSCSTTSKWASGAHNSPGVLIFASDECAAREKTFLRPSPAAAEEGEEQATDNMAVVRRGGKVKRESLSSRSSSVSGNGDSVRDLYKRSGKRNTSKSAANKVVDGIAAAAAASDDDDEAEKSILFSNCIERAKEVPVEVHGSADCRQRFSSHERLSAKKRLWREKSNSFSFTTRKARKTQKEETECKHFINEVVCDVQRTCTGEQHHKTCGSTCFRNDERHIISCVQKGKAVRGRLMEEASSMSKHGSSSSSDLSGKCEAPVQNGVNSIGEYAVPSNSFASNLRDPDNAASAREAAAAAEENQICDVAGKLEEEVAVDEEEALHLSELLLGTRVLLSKQGSEVEGKTNQSIAKKGKTMANLHIKETAE